jgi:hypothetical protein
MRLASFSIEVRTNISWEMMRRRQIQLMLMCGILFAAARAAGMPCSNSSKGDKVGERSELCLRPEHDHTYSDLRIAAIEVEKVDECGFEFANLSDNTVGARGAGHRVYYADDFYVVRINGERVKRSGYRAMKRGMRGTIIYCSASECQRVFAMQLVPDQAGFMVTGPGR